MTDLGDYTRRTICNAAGAAIGYAILGQSGCIIGVALGSAFESFVGEALYKISNLFKNASENNNTIWPDGKVLYFVNFNNNENDIEKYEIIKLPINHTVHNELENWDKTIGLLKTVNQKFVYNQVDKSLAIDIVGLSISTCIAIGYAFHRNTHITLFYENRGKRFGSDAKCKPIKFKNEYIQPKINNASNKSVDLCIYIRAKKEIIGDGSFTNFIDSEDNTYITNPCQYIFINSEEYDEKTDLLETAKYLNKMIELKYDALSKQYSQVNVHLFFNGFAGLALMLGSQITQTIPVALYDYSMITKTYSPTVLLSVKLFQD